MIKEQYNTGGMSLKLIEQKQKDANTILAIYSTHSIESGASAGYELHIVRKKVRTKDFHNMKKGEVRWVNPATSEFGLYGWHITSLDKAKDRLNELL